MDRAAQRQPTLSFRVPTAVKVAAILLVVAGVSLAVREVAPWATDYPIALVVPLSDWITAFFEWLPYVDFGLFTVRDVTKAFVWLLNQPLLLTEGLLFRGFPELGLPPLPWVVIVVLAGVIGFNSGGPRLALLAVMGTGYLALFGLWALSMETLSLVIVTVPVVALVGLALGILAIRRPRFEAALNALFDVLQCTPHLAYLVPVVVLFGLGQVPAIIATGIFAMPPMARCVILGIRSVPREVIEAGMMAGATRRQLLWRVQFPAARPIVMVGLNQVIMQTLAMVVIASLIGAKGLGHNVLVKLDMLWLGQALEAGVGIVVLAVLLDRISQAYATRRRVHRKTEEAAKRKIQLVVSASLLGVAVLLGALDHRFHVPTPEWTVSTASFWDGLVDYVSEHWYGPLMAFRNAALVYLLIPVKEVLSWLPWTVIVAGAGLLGYVIGGRRLAVLCAALLTFPAVMGLWVPTITTIYMIGIAIAICILLGFPLGLLAARSDRFSRIIMPVCDTLQTLPSFIYLVPVVMLFKVGDVAAIMAVIGYSMVPMIRFTNLGLRRVPAHTREAAIASGASSFQLLRKVDLPLALPEIMLGVNQTIIMGLFTLSITALVGARDLGAQIIKALALANPGQGLIAGLCVACLAITADRLIAQWSRARKKKLGLA